MWYLTCDADQRIIYVVPQCNIITVGRSADDQICNFAILEDPSISRKHATLILADNSLYLEDLGSRYGTFVNESMVKVEMNNKIKLNVGDIVKFGKMNSIWKVHETNLVTCTSTLKGETLQNLKQILSKIGGTLSNDWNDTCEYVTMPAITLTIKVVLALVQGSHIVTTEFWNQCLEAISNHAQLPDPKNFTPQIIESTLNKEVVSFLPDLQRKSLFVGKNIIFFSRRQFEMYKTVLLNSSASPLLLSESKMTKSRLCEKDVIVIQYNLTNTSQETQAQRVQINDIVSYLKSKGKRIVADAEIGLAILYCSLDKYCNPDFNYSSEVIKQISGPNNKTTINVLVPESQETSQLKGENVIISESLVSNDNTSSASASTDIGIRNKRKLSNETDDIHTSSTKKLATEIINISDNNGKRKFDDSEEISTNPIKKIAVDSEDDDFFNFMNPSNGNKNKAMEKKLNLSKPLKRKADLSANDDDLFNFVETNTKQKTTDVEATKPSLFDRNENVENINTAKNDFKKTESITAKDVTAMRGEKLEELMKDNVYMNSNFKRNVKKEPNDDLDEKMNELDLGFTIVKIRNDLIIKKEPLQVEERNNQVRNFKKFKKVWPVKMQVTIIPRSSMSIAATEMGDISSMANII